MLEIPSESVYIVWYVIDLPDSHMILKLYDVTLRVNVKPKMLKFLTVAANLNKVKVSDAVFGFLKISDAWIIKIKLKFVIVDQLLGFGSFAWNPVLSVMLSGGGIIVE